MSEEYDKYYKKGGSYELPTEIFNDLLEQLETHKQKENKLREYINTWVVNEYSIYVLTGENSCKSEPNAIENLLQILNEGDK